MKLTISIFSDVNAERQDESFPLCANWTLSDWGVALAGETGEVCNWIKKLKRLEDMNAYGGVDALQLKKEIARELTDVITYADLLMTKLGYSLDTELVEKFNAVSIRVGSKIFLEKSE